MRHEIKNSPDYASLHVLLDEGESLVTEAGAMMAMDASLTMSTNMKGGLMGAAKRALGGESVFLNTYTGTGPGQRLDVAPSSPGDMVHLTLDGNNAIMVQRGSYCASTPGIEVQSKWGGAKSLFGGEGVIMLRCEGAGELFLSSYGAIHLVEVGPAGYTVDTGHIVAFEDTLTFNVTSSGGMKSLFLSKEGLVCKFSGMGKLWIQTRNAPALAGFLHPFRRVKTKN